MTLECVGCAHQRISVDNGTPARVGGFAGVVTAVTALRGCIPLRSLNRGRPPWS